MTQTHDETTTPKASDRFRYNCYLSDGSTELGPHRHAELEIVYVIEGSCDLSINGKHRSTMRKGALIPFSSADQHQFFLRDDEKCLFYVAHFDGYLVSNALTSKYIEMTGSAVFFNNEPMFHQIQSEFEFLRQEINRDPSVPERDNLILNIISRILLLSHRAFIDQSLDLGGMPITLKKALAYINLYFQHPISLDEVADHVGLSRFQFSKLFRKQLDGTFQSHLLEKRLQWAYNSLQTTHLSISEVSEQAGFHSRSYFCNKFKERFNITPGDLKRGKTR